MPPLHDVMGGGDAQHAAVVPVREILSGQRKLAFDHSRIVADAVDHITDELDGSAISLAFLGPAFTLSDLRNVHEAITGKTLDAANFRRDLLAIDPPIIESTGQRSTPGSEGGRPAELFRRAKRFEVAVQAGRRSV